MKLSFKQSQMLNKKADAIPKTKRELNNQFGVFKKTPAVKNHFADKMWCAKCGSTQNLTFDHIKPRGRYPELTRQLDNLQILCLFKCHAFKTSIEKTDWFDNDKFLRGDYDK